MTDTLRKPERLTIYDPRVSDRSILIDGGVWSSAKTGVVFFETNRYADYTDAKYVSALLNVLISESNPAQFGLRISEVRPQGMLSWLKICRPGEAVGFTNVANLTEVMDFFDREANSGVWDFYGAKHSFANPDTLVPFPGVLNHADQFCFVVEIDLDSILMGFSFAESNIDRLIQRLRSLV